MSVIQVRSLIDAKVIVEGSVTKIRYIFPSSGSLGINEATGQVGIDIRDVDEIINKKRGRACCGGVSGASLFEVVEGI